MISLHPFFEIKEERGLLVQLVDNKTFYITLEASIPDDYEKHQGFTCMTRQPHGDLIRVISWFKDGALKAILEATSPNGKISKPDAVVGSDSKSLEMWVPQEASSEFTSILTTGGYGDTAYYVHREVALNHAGIDSADAVPEKELEEALSACPVVDTSHLSVYSSKKSPYTFKWRHAVTDEYQDIDEAQFAITCITAASEVDYHHISKPGELLRHDAVSIGIYRGDTLDTEMSCCIFVVPDSEPIRSFIGRPHGIPLEILTILPGSDIEKKINGDSKNGE